MTEGMNVTNKMVSAANSQLEKADRLEGHTSVEKMTDQAAGEALSKMPGEDVFANVRNRPLPKPVEKFVPMPSLEQFEKDSEGIGSIKEEVDVLNKESNSESMDSVKQEVEMPKASKMSSAERVGRPLVANLVELGQRIQAIAENIFGGAKKIYSQIKSAAQSQSQPVPNEVKSDFGKNLYRALSDGSMNTVSREGIARNIDMIKDETEKGVLYKVLDQQIPGDSNPRVESEESTANEPKETPAPSVPKQLSSSLSQAIAQNILDEAPDVLDAKLKDGSIQEEIRNNDKLSDLEKQVLTEMLLDKKMTSTAKMPQKITKMENTTGFVGFQCEVEGKLSRAQIRELADRHFSTSNSSALFIFQRTKDNDVEQLKVTTVMRDTDKNKPIMDNVFAHDDNIQKDDDEQIFLKFK